ncbi:hypothetical protein JNUCC42_06865 [Brevibacterium sp. JNUCC-42]|nr:hypothetical protein JNUCC42_06865 [Brevibacterium sp. JNUCC-42]
MHLDEKWTHKQIDEYLGINDKDRVKAWMRKKYRIVESLSTMYPITEVCMVLGVSRSGYYKYLSTRNLHSRIQAELLRQFGCRVTHKKVLRIIAKFGTQSHHSS